MSSNEAKKVGVKAFRNRGIIFTILAICLIASGVFFGMKPFDGFTKRITWKQIEGEIVGFEKELVSQNSSEYKFIPTIDFSVQDNETTEVKADPQKEQPTIGEKVKVFYDEKNPGAAVVGDYPIVNLIIPVVLLVLGAIGLILAIISFRKMKKAKAYQNQLQNSMNQNINQTHFVQNFVQQDNGRQQ